MASFALLRRTQLRTKVLYFHPVRNLHRQPQQSIHPNSCMIASSHTHTQQTNKFFADHTVLYNAYFKRPSLRKFTTNSSEKSSKTKYIPSVLFAGVLIGGGAAYYLGWTEDIIAFTQRRFKYLSSLTDKPKSSAFKLPKPAKTAAVSDQSSSEIRTISTIDSIPTNSKQKIETMIPDIIDISETPPIKESKQQIKVRDIAIAKPQMTEKKSKIIQNDKDKISEEMMKNFEKIKSAAAQIEQKKVKKVKKIYKTESERYIAEISELRQAMDQKLLKIEELERLLSEKSEFIETNMKKLEDGRNAYDEMVQIFEEMRVEYGEQMIQQMESMEDERRSRLDKLAKFKLDLGVFERVMAFYDDNNKFFMNLAEVNNVIYKFENKINRGLVYDNELKYLLTHLPKSFISHQLLSNLNASQSNDQNESFHINSHEQLYDRFCVLENTLRQTVMTPKSSNSLWGNLLAKIFGSLLMREQIARSGESLNDRISRAGFSMKLGDLSSALDELNCLDEDVLYPAQDWIKCARQRMLGLSAVQMIKTELLSRSVNVVMDNE